MGEQPLARDNHEQPLVGDNHEQPLVGGNHGQPLVGGNHEQPLVGGNDLRLPNPAVHGAALGGLSALLTAIATSAHQGADFGHVLRHTLAAVGGCVGATAAAVLLIPSLLNVSEAHKPRFARYASVTSLPLAAGGLASLLPQALPSTIAIAALGVLAYRSGSLGARIFLNFSGIEKTRAAAVTALVSTLPGLLAAPLCAAR
jgi:hypothetical protein